MMKQPMTQQLQWPQMMTKRYQTKKKNQRIGQIVPPSILSILQHHPKEDSAAQTNHPQKTNTIFLNRTTPPHNLNHVRYF